VARALLILLFAGGLAGCKACEHAPVPKDDEPKIKAILEADGKLDRALKEADDESAKGNDAKAAEVLDSKATAAADDAIRVAEAQTPVTGWGNEQKGALLGVLHERRDAIPPYAKALRSDDLDAKLGAVEKQIDLEKRAMDVASKASQTP